MCAATPAGPRSPRSRPGGSCRRKLPFGWVDFPPAVNRLIGLWWLGKIFYPERFPEDIKTLARDFYTLFYHVTPTEAQIERVLAGSD